MPRKEIGTYTRKWKEFPRAWIAKINTVKMVVLTKEQSSNSMQTPSKSQ